MNLKSELHNLKKGDDTVDIYLQKIKVVRDKLLAIGVIVDDEELFHIAIKGLPKEYNAFKSAIRTRSTQLCFDELSTMLNAEGEALNEGSEIKDSIFALVASTNQKSNGHNYNQNHNRGRGRGNFNNRGGRGGRGSNGSYPQFNSQFPHNSVPSIISNKVNQVLEVLDQIDLFVKFVERLDIWLWTVIIGWIMPIKANIHLQSWQQWPLLQMLASLKISLG